MFASLAVIASAGVAVKTHAAFKAHQSASVAQSLESYPDDSLYTFEQNARPTSVYHERGLGSHIDTYRNLLATQEPNKFTYAKNTRPTSFRKATIKLRHKSNLGHMWF